jgi:hypothetical protein
MLKLHHMNLLNEIQETTLMMNLYQQQQLQQQQQQLQQQQATADQGSVGGDQQIAMLLQQGSALGGIDPLFGNGGGLSQRGSLGLGVGIDQQNQQMQMLRQQKLLQAAGPSGGSVSAQLDIVKGQQEQAALEERLQKLKDDIARRQKEADQLESSAKSSAQKRKADEGDKPSLKRVKAEKSDDDGDGDEV